MFLFIKELDFACRNTKLLPNCYWYNYYILCTIMFIFAIVDVMVALFILHSNALRIHFRLIHLFYAARGPGLNFNSSHTHTQIFKKNWF